MFLDPLTLQGTIPFPKKDGETLTPWREGPQSVKVNITTAALNLRLCENTARLEPPQSELHNQTGAAASAASFERYSPMVRVLCLVGKRHFAPNHSAKENKAWSRHRRPSRVYLLVNRAHVKRGYRAFFAFFSIDCVREKYLVCVMVATVATAAAVAAGAAATAAVVVAATGGVDIAAG